MSIAAVILAAGSSSRMGSPKALLPIDNTTFVHRIAATARAAGANHILIVLGPPDGDRVKGQLPVGAAWAWNHDPSRGMSTSVQAALNVLPNRTLGMLLWPVDQPLVRVDTVIQIMTAAPGRIIVPRHEGRGGHPVRIPQRFFPQIAGLPAEEGLRGLLQAEAAAITYVDVDDPGVVQDFDRPEDLAALTPTEPPIAVAQAVAQEAAVAAPEAAPADDDKKPPRSRASSRGKRA